MALYNVQKRQTLDRLTLKYQLQMRGVLKKETQGLVRDFRDSLDAGRQNFAPTFRGLDIRMEPVFEAHREKTIYVAVSDGIQEVTPGDDFKLGLWQAYPATIWIEDTLSTQLAGTRDQLAETFWQKLIKRDPDKPLSLARDLMGGYTEALSKAYRSLARSWLDQGEDSIGEIQAALSKVLRVSDSSAERIFRTETTNYFNESRQDYFAVNTSVDYMELYAVTDGRISKICEDRHRAVVTILEAALRKYMPAFHPHCRTIQRPLISALTTHKKIIDIGLALRAARESSWTPAAW